MAKKTKPAPEPVVEETEDEEASAGRGPTEFHVAMAAWLEETFGGKHSVETVALAQTKRKQFRQSDEYKELIAGREEAKAQREQAKAARAAAAEADEDDDEDEAPKPKKGKKAKATAEATEPAPEVKAKGKKGKAKTAESAGEDAAPAKGKGKRKAAF